KITLLTLLFISSISFSQYVWEIKQSGSSLGGPIDVEKYNPNNVYYGSGSTIFKSTDRGETFFPLGTPVPGATSIKNIILNDENPAEFLVATTNSIVKTTNSGATWVTKASGLSFSFFGIPMTPDPTHPDTIYTMSGLNFMRSTDFGETWTTLTNSVGCSSPCDIEVFPDTSIILVGDNGTGIFRSTDYGQTWAVVFDANSGEVPTISVSHQSGTAWATRWGGGGGILKSTDYGATWTFQSALGSSNMWGVHVQPTDENMVIAGCYSCGTTWRTNNGGNTWQLINIAPSNYQIFIVDSITQFAAQSSGFYKLDSPYFIPVELISFTGNIVDGKIYLEWKTATEINNQGFELEISYDNQTFEKIAFIQGFGTSSEEHTYSYVYHNLPSEKIYFRLKQIDFDGTYDHSSVIEIEGTVPSEYNLSQNFPNPFNPSTSISFSLPVDASVKIELYNMLGEKLSDIVNSQFKAGINKIDFIADGL